MAKLSTNENEILKAKMKAWCISNPVPVPRPITATSFIPLIYFIQWQIKKSKVKKQFIKEIIEHRS